MRLSFCYPTPERIREGVRRLASVITQELELRTMFGTPPGRSLPGSDSPTSQAPRPDLA